MLARLSFVTARRAPSPYPAADNAVAPATFGLGNVPSRVLQIG
ncbi:protein of unknown function [Cupriavidus taiwanensis]|nr:protein of unknown function [Cupriavidus taiwanensis]